MLIMFRLVPAVRGTLLPVFTSGVGLLQTALFPGEEQVPHNFLQDGIVTKL